MKHLVQKIANSTATLIGKVAVGDIDISVGCRNELVIGMVNGYKVVDAGLYDDFIPKISPVMARIIAKIYRDKWSEESNTLTFYNEDWDTDGLYPSKNLLERILFYLKKHLDGNAILVISKPQNVITSPRPDITNNASPTVNFSALVDVLNKYKVQIEMLSMYLDRSVELASILTKRQLISTMYGASETQKVLDNIRDKVTQIRPELVSLPAWASISTKSIQQLTYRLSKNLMNNDNEKMFTSTVLIPNITDNYEKIKSYTIKMVTVLAPLVYIDEVFKTYVKYPATWFLPTNNMEDLNESYEILIEFLANVPSIETKIMDPLNLLRIHNIMKEFN